MNYSIYRISLDIHKTASQLSFSARQGDTSRRLYISLVENGAPYVISQDCYAVFAARKPDGTVIFNDCTIQDNMIIYDMTEQTTALVGRCECEVSLYGRDGEMLSSPRFAYTVYASVGAEDGVISTDEVTALRSLITEANGAISRTNRVADNVERKLDNGEFIGEPGNSIIFRFSAHKDGTDFSTSWSPGKIYMGVASVPSDEPAPTDKSAYTWTFFATNILEVIPVTLSASAWSGGAQTIECTLIDESALIPSPTEDSMDAYVASGIRLKQASEDDMVFTCKVTPTVDITVNVLVLQPLTYALPKATSADAGKCMCVDSEGNWVAGEVEDASARQSIEEIEDTLDEMQDSDPFVVMLNADETALSNTTFVDIGNALYVNGKVLELRYRNGLKSYRSCSYLYTPADAASSVFEAELLFFVPFAEHGNGYTFPGRKIVKITASGVSVLTTLFNESM